MLRKFGSTSSSFFPNRLSHIFSLLQIGKLIPHIRRGIIYVHTVLSHHFLMNWHFFCYSLITSHCPAISQEFGTQWVLGPNVSRFWKAVELKPDISPVSSSLMWSWKYTLVVVTIKPLISLVTAYSDIDGVLCLKLTSISFSDVINFYKFLVT